MIVTSFACYIYNKIKLYNPNVLIYSTNIADDFANKFNMEKQKAKKIVNVYMCRLQKKGTIQRIKKGVYVKNKKTTSGNIMTVDLTTAITRLITEDKGRVIGYETAPSIFNKIGLSTWLTTDIAISTNKYRTSIPNKARVKLYVPKTKITDWNFRYLQILDIIAGLEKYHVDAVAPEKIICKMINKLELDPLILIFLAKAHYLSILSKTIEMLYKELKK